MLSVYNADTKFKCIIGEIETSSLKVFVDLYWLYVARWLAGLDGCSISNSVPSIIALKFSMSLTANSLVIPFNSSNVENGEKHVNSLLINSIELMNSLLPVHAEIPNKSDNITRVVFHLIRTSVKMNWFLVVNFILVYFG